MNIFTRLGEFLLMLKGMFTKPENWRIYWKELMSVSKWYVIKPRLGRQLESFSDIDGRVVNHGV
jgi:hypothetical protein